MRARPRSGPGSWPGTRARPRSRAGSRPGTRARPRSRAGSRPRRRPPRRLRIRRHVAVPARIVRALAEAHKRCPLVLLEARVLGFAAGLIRAVAADGAVLAALDARGFV